MRALGEGERWGRNSDMFKFLKTTRLFRVVKRKTKVSVKKDLIKLSE